jgi:hypothetical protein
MKDAIKRSDQIAMLEKCADFTKIGVYNGCFSYPNCSHDLVTQGLVTHEGQITVAGRAALFFLGKGPDPTESKAVITFNINLKPKEAPQNEG